MPLTAGYVSITVIVLAALCFDAGRNNHFLQSYGLVSIDTIELKQTFLNNTNASLPIRDEYTYFIKKECGSYYATSSELAVPIPTQDQPGVGITCSDRSNAAPGDLILNDLKLHGSNATLASIGYPQEIDQRFTDEYNHRLYLAKTCYIVALVFMGLATLFDFATFLALGWLGLLTPALIALASIFLLVASVEVTKFQNHATGFINATASGISAYHNSGFRKLTWSSFGLSVFGFLLWTMTWLVGMMIRD